MPRRSFDALFVHGLPPSEGLAEALRALGYAPGTSREHFSLTVWRQALELARRHVYGSLEPAEGLRQLGHCYAEGFSQTLIGRVFRATVARLGPERCLVRLPTFLRAARAGVTLTLHAQGTHHWLAEVSDPQPLPDFGAGIVERVLQVAGARARVEVTRRDAEGFTLSIRW